MKKESLDRFLGFLGFALLAAAVVVIVTILVTDSPDRNSSGWAFLAALLGFAAMGVGYLRAKGSHRRS